MTANPPDYRFDLGVADCLRDLELLCLAQLFYEARQEAKALRRALSRGADVLSTMATDDLLRLQVLVRQGLSTCTEAMPTWEKGFLLAHEWSEQRGQELIRHQSFLDRLRGNLRFIGSDGVPQTWSLLGWIEDHPDWPFALSRDSGHVILIAGTPGSGKTVFSTLVAEGSLTPGEPLSSSHLHACAYCFFHIEENDRLPQLLDGLKPNPTRADLEQLAGRLGVGPIGLARLRLAVPATALTDELMERLQPYIDLGLEVVPLKVHLGQLGQAGLEAALGAEPGTRFVQRILEEAQKRGKSLRVADLRDFIESATDLNEGIKRSARVSLRLLAELEAEKETDPGLWQLVEPGVATVFYLGGLHTGHAQVAPIIVAMMSGMMMPSPEHGPFQRVIAVDEVNLLAKDAQVWQAFLRAARLVRHRGSALILMGQDLMCVPDEMFGLAGIVAVMQQRSPVIWEDIHSRFGPLHGWKWSDVKDLGTAEAIVAVAASSDKQWRGGGYRVKLRAPLCMHGGGTRAMV